ncbi:hypothetical protein BJ741DRAFT_715095 [Chytriomyces cf. hyalinus JEL632]|nr:hypothetical protein BJ741DRAFT_715095 [Chytriomyces cf. hyalinus JEL632]
MDLQEESIGSFSVVSDNYTLQHPSIFQNPAKDIQLNASPEKLRLVDPDAMWGTSTRKRLKMKHDPLDPPFTPSELESVKAKMNVYTIVTSDRVEPSLLFCAFFSVYNIRTLQKLCQRNVLKNSGYTVKVPDVQPLAQAMEGVYERYADEAAELEIPSRQLVQHIRVQMLKLDTILLSQCVPRMIDEATYHLTYLTQFNTPVESRSLSRPENTGIAGTRELRDPLSAMKM